MAAGPVGWRPASSVAAFPSSGFRPLLGIGLASLFCVFITAGGRQEPGFSNPITSALSVQLPARRLACSAPRELGPARGAAARRSSGSWAVVLEPLVLG